MGLKDRENLTPDQRWETALDDLSTSTARTYRREFNEFLAWAEETPQGLIGYWIEIKDDSDKMMNLNDHIISYVQGLTEAGHSGGKQNSAICALKKFYKVNGFNIIINQKNMIKGEGARPAKPEEIREAFKYDVSRPKATALIAISKDSGLRVSDIVRIQFKHIQPIIDNPDLEFHGFQMPVHKTRAKRRQALPCLGIDGITQLRNWLKVRGEYGLTTDQEDYVFVNTKNMNGTGKKCVLGERMDERNAAWMVIKLFQKIGYDDLSSNSLRKFNTTTLSLSGMPESLVKAMHGKHQQSSMDNYLKATAGQMLEVYKKHYESLVVEVRPTKRYVESLEATIAELKAIAPSKDVQLQQQKEIEVIKEMQAEMKIAVDLLNLSDAERAELEKLRQLEKLKDSPP